MSSHPPPHFSILSLDPIRSSPPPLLSSSTSLFFPHSPLWVQRSIMPILQGDRKGRGNRLGIAKDRQILCMTRVVKREMRDRVTPAASPFSWKMEPISSPLLWNPTAASDQRLGDMSPCCGLLIHSHDRQFSHTAY